MKSHTILVGLLSVFALCAPAPTFATILHVDADGTGEYPTINAAIEAAVEGDTIELGNGVFSGSGNRNLTFGGKNLVLTSLGGSATTIVDLEGSLESNAVRRFLALENGETSATVVEGITIRNCLFQEDGGAFLINGASPVIRDIVFDAIQTKPHYLLEPIREIRGGAIFVRAGAPTISDCIFQDFWMPSGSGGAIYANGAGPMVVEGCTFRDNAVLYYVVSLTNGQIVDCVFEHNSGYFEPWGTKASVRQHAEGSKARGFGYRSASPLGAFVGPVEVRSCTFKENGAFDGGGLTAIGSIAVEDCYFDGNGADIGGAVVAGGGVTLRSCTFIGNGALVAGAVDMGTGEMIDCIVRDCTSHQTSGAIAMGFFPHRNQGSPNVRISGCTLYGNYGGGIGFGSGTLLVERSIVAFGTYGRAINCEEDPQSITLTCCDLFGNAGGDWTDGIADQLGKNGNISADPLFCDPNTDNFTLFSNSPCAPAYSNGCGLIGAYDVGCAPLSVGVDPRMEMKSWGKIKGMYR